MRQTIADQVTATMEIKGYKLVGKTSGTYSFRKGTNLARTLENMGLTEATCEVRTGARAGKHKTEGYELLIFIKR